MSYKDTLNLPKTAFPMKANLAQREPTMLARWQQQDIYGQLRQARQGAKSFILHDGPPYANGHLHIGHAVNKVLKDIVVKSKSMSGYDAPYVPGWDCHGLPIELNVEKKLGKPGVKVSVEAFRQACRDYAHKHVKIQSEEFQRFGVLGDWQHPYLSMDFEVEANIVRALSRILENDHLVKGYKPVHWCLDCRSALAEAEVEYKDKTSPSIDVAYKVEDLTELSQRFALKTPLADNTPVDVVIWTTTPWTLPASRAVSVHPELNYVLVQCNINNKPAILLLAEALYQSACERYQASDITVLATCQGSALDKLSLQHPFYDRDIPVILGEHVTTDAGTGAVHTAPAHGLDDYAVGKRYQLCEDNPVGANGCYLENTPLVAGEHVFKANDKIIEILTDKQRLLALHKLEHSYPHCWRHKSPLIFRATPQWFISMDKKGLRQQALAEIEKTTWIPDWGQARIAGMVEGRPDWCISRQRTWGVPITLFVHKQTGDLHPNMPALMNQIADLIKQDGIDVWYSLDAKTLLGDEAEHYEKITDTLDVWFDSGVTHYAVLEQRQGLHSPADLYLEGSDQHRGWFNSSLMTGVAINNRAPYLSVLTHGFTVDAKGHKMSKSLGNVVAPDKVIKNLGADVMRLWIASTDYRAEIYVSDEILKRTSDAYRRLRNTARYLLSNLFDFDPNQHIVEANQLLALDQWIINQAAQLQDELIKDYDAYQFHHVVQKLHHFCAIELGSFYLDIIKDRQYTCQTESIARRSAQTAMFHIVEALVRWLAPIISFTADEIWQFIPGQRDESVLLSTWYQGLAVNDNQLISDQDWQAVISIREEVNKELEAQRNAGVIGSALAAEVTLRCEPELAQRLAKFGDELRFIFITSAFTIESVDTRPEQWIVVKASTVPKCVRCWHHQPDIGKNSEHPELCGRCIENIIGSGEQRLFA